MKIITRGCIDMATSRVLREEEDSFEYSGRVARAMPDAFNFQDISQVKPLIPAAVNAAAPTTGSGSWVDVTNYIGDALLVIDVGAHAGAYGSLKVQLQTATATTGAGAANYTQDARNSGLITIVADGTYVMPFDTDSVANAFVGVVCTYTTITSATFGVTLLGRLSNN